MGNSLCDSKDVRFFLHELLNVEEPGESERYKDCLRETFDLLGMPGIAQGTTAYFHALNFARDRKQGTAGDKKAPDQDSFMVQAHVRRDLLWMKCYTEGVRALVLYAICCMDRVNATGDANEKRKWNDILEVLTPICKVYGGDKGFEVFIKANQFLGGYGNCPEHNVEKFARDCNITSIYEGTKGIQSLDLVNRKISMKNGRAYQAVLFQIKETIEEALEWNELIPYASDLKSYIGMLEETTENIQSMKIAGSVDLVESWAPLYLEIWGDILLGWLFLWQARAARERLAISQKQFNTHNDEAPDYFNNAFYTGKIVTAKYYLGTLLPLVTGKFEAIRKNDCVFRDREVSYFFD